MSHDDDAKGRMHRCIDEIATSDTPRPAHRLSTRDASELVKTLRGKPPEPAPNTQADSTAAPAPQRPLLKP